MIHYLIVFLISMVPLIEMRLAIPYGLALAEEFALSPILIYVISIVGNCLPVPFILFFVHKILAWMQTSRVAMFRKIAGFLFEKGHKGLAKVEKYADFGLYLFVAIPLPGTGAWSGALIAALLDMKKRYAFLSIALGVVTAGFIIWLLTHGVLAGLDFLA